MVSAIKKLAWGFTAAGILMLPWFLLGELFTVVLPGLEDISAGFILQPLVVLSYLLCQFAPLLLCFGIAFALFQLEKALNELDFLALNRADSAKDAANASVAKLEQTVDARLSALEEASRPEEA